MDVGEPSSSRHNQMPWAPLPISALSAVDPPVMQSSGVHNSGAAAAPPREDVFASSGCWSKSIAPWLVNFQFCLIF